MRSRTSFFNKTVLKKDIIRFSPVWGVYTVFLLLVLFGIGFYDQAMMADDILDTLHSMAVINLLYAGICAAALFHDLYSTRHCYALHAFPLRRDGWLATHLLTGFLFSFVPNLLICLLTAPLLGKYAYIVPIWLSVTTLQFVFFFGTAVLATMCAGHTLGMVAVYAIIHFIIALILLVINLFYQPLLHGIELDTDILLICVPTILLCASEYVDFQVVDTVGHLVRFAWEWWICLGIFVGIGIGCLFVARRLYRRRQLEIAGNLIAVRWLAHTFLVIAAIAAGAQLYTFAQLFGGAGYVFLLAGLSLGYFLGSMLLKRSVKVFTKRAFLGFGVLVTLLGVSFLVTWLDPIGITRYVPEVDEIKQAAIFGSDQSYRSIDDFSDPSKYSGFSITDTEELTDVTDLHRQLVSYRTNSYSVTKVDIVYVLKNGRTVKRAYQVALDSDQAQQLEKHFSDMRYIFQVNDVSDLYKRFDVVRIRSSDSPDDLIKLHTQAEIAGLLDAIAKDCAAGSMATNYIFHKQNSDYTITFYQFDDTASDLYLRVYPECTNTIAYIAELIETLPEE